MSGRAHVSAAAGSSSSFAVSSSRFPPWYRAVLSRVLSFLPTRIHRSLAAAFPFAFAPPPPSRLPLDRDTLGSVLSFLSLRELAAALSVSHEWTAAVRTMRPAMLTADIMSDELLATPSLLHRHVRQIGRKDACKLLLLPHQLPTLAHALPQLRSLNTAVDLRPIGEEAPLEDSESVASLLAPIGALRQLHALQLQLFDDGVSLTPLQHLPLLRDLELDLPFDRFPEQFPADVRALHWLHRLHIHGGCAIQGCAAIFTALLRDASEEELRALQWRDFAFNGLKFTDALTPLLLRLSSLECLEINLADCTRMDFLAALPRLTHLELYVHYMKADAWTNLLDVFTSDGLTRLHTLHLYGGPCSNDDAVTLLSHTPTLTSLYLCDLKEVSSLSFFRQLPKLAETLTQLTLNCCNRWRLTAADLPPLCTLQQLRTLRLLRWTSVEPERMTAADRAPFEQRPCAALPHLEVFEWMLPSD
jgi:hypothetical protein